MEKATINKILLAFLMTGITACVSVPELQNTKKIIQQDIPKQTGSLVKSENWWLQYNDKQLNTVIEEVLNHNIDIKIALLNIEKINEMTKLSQSNLLPTVDFSANIQREKLSAQGFYPAPLGGSVINFSQIGLNANYNPDLYGKYNALIIENNNKALALQEQREYIKFNLSLQTVKLYGYWQYLLEQENIIQEQIKINNVVLQLIQKKIALGTAVTNDVLIAQNNIKNLTILSNQVVTNKETTKNALTQLTGSMSNTINVLLDDRIIKNIIKPVESISSENIINRHEIKYYLFNINAQESRLKSLKTDFYPSVSLNGQVGLQKIGLGNIFSTNNLFSSIGPTISLPIFNAQQITTNYKVAGIDLNIFIMQYNQAVIKSYYDINDNLFKLKQQYAVYLEQKDIFLNQEKQFSLVQKSEQLGKSSHFDLLIAKNNFNNQQQNLIAAKFNYFTSNIELINALGGITITQ